MPQWILVQATQSHQLMGVDAVAGRGLCLLPLSSLHGDSAGEGFLTHPCSHQQQCPAVLSSASLESTLMDDSVFSSDLETFLNLTEAAFCFSQGMTKFT